MAAVFFDVEFPENSPLDMVFEGHKLCYTVVGTGRTQTVECLAVLDATGVVAEGESESALKTGDIFVSVNGEPLINLLLNRHRNHQRNSGDGPLDFVEEAAHILDEQEALGGRVIRFLRPHTPSIAMNAEGIEILADITVLTLRQEEASLIFDEVKQREYVEKKMAREYERQQAEEQRARERQVQMEAHRAHAEVRKQEIRNDVAKLRDMEKKLMEMQYVVDCERKRVAVMESNFYAENVATSDIHEVKYPDHQQALGLTIVPMKVTLVSVENEDRTLLVDVCIVTQSTHSAEVHVGDLVVQINGMPLVTNTGTPARTDDDVRAFHERVLDTIAIARRPRTLLVLRPSGPTLETFRITMSLTMFYVYLSAEQEKVIFTGPMPTVTEGTVMDVRGGMMQPSQTMLFGSSPSLPNPPTSFVSAPPASSSSSSSSSSVMSSSASVALPTLTPVMPSSYSQGGAPAVPMHAPLTSHAYPPMAAAPAPMSMPMHMPQPQQLQPQPQHQPMPQPMAQPLQYAPYSAPPPPARQYSAAVPLPAPPAPAPAHSYPHHYLPPPVAAPLQSYPPPTGGTVLAPGIVLRSAEEEEIARQVDAEIRRFKAEEEMKRMQELRRKAEEEEMLRKIEEQALREIEEEKRKLAALKAKTSSTL